MKYHLPLFLFISLLVSVPPSVQAAGTTQLSIDSGSYTLYNSNNSTILSGGAEINPVDGDGDVIQIGYYTGATSSSNLFTGTWVALTGNGGANSAFNTTSIGDQTSQGAGDGTFALNLTFTSGSPTSGVYPAIGGKILALRFYNGTTVANSTYYGAVSDASWTWAAPATTPPSILGFSLDNPGVSFLSNDSSALNETAFTGTPLMSEAPEPSTATELLLAFCAVGIFRYYRGTRRSI
jgi:hypothetical protein